MRGKDLIAATLFGGAGGSSGGGSGGGGSSGGGSIVAVSPKEVNFYDYDGTLLHAYTVAEAQALSELPAGPEHPGLVFQGWNWSLEDVKGLTRDMNIGAMYTTDDGTTRLYITLQEGRTSPMLGVGVNGTVTVDWGDGTEPDVLTGTSTSTTKWTPNHNYAAPGDYVIRLTVDGEMAFTGDSALYTGACVLRHSSEAKKINNAYKCALKRVEVGNNVNSFGYCAFSNCYSLKTITIPRSVTNWGTYAPSGTLRTFYYCYDLVAVTIPGGTDFNGLAAFNSCYNLACVPIPNSVTTFGGQMFQYCYNLAGVPIPNSVTNFGASMFAYSGAPYCDFTTYTEVPPLTTASALTNTREDFEIRVPAALYDEWIAATNWATYADYIKAY